MTLLGSAARNAATIVVQELHSVAAASREAAAAATEAAAADADANAEKVVRDKAYRAVDDAAEEDRVAEAPALAMAWYLLGKEEEEDWRCARRTAGPPQETSTAGSMTRNRPRRCRRGQRR
jgi:hypothetical protein